MQQAYATCQPYKRKIATSNQNSAVTHPEPEPELASEPTDTEKSTNAKSSPSVLAVRAKLAGMLLSSKGT